MTLPNVSPVSSRFPAWQKSEFQRTAARESFLPTRWPSQPSKRPILLRFETTIAFKQLPLPGCLCLVARLRREHQRDFLRDFNVNAIYKEKKINKRKEKKRREEGLIGDISSFFFFYRRTALKLDYSELFDYNGYIVLGPEWAKF